MSFAINQKRIYAILYASILCTFCFPSDTNSISANTGIRISSGPTELYFYTGIPKTAVTWPCKTDLSAWTICRNARTGVSIALQDCTGIPLTLYGGRISFLGNLSLLKTPQRSFPVNARRISDRGSGLHIRLPSGSGNTEPGAIAFRFTPAPFRFECVFFENSGFFASAGTTLLYQTSMKTTVSVTGGRFYLKPRTSNSWYRSTRSFSPGWYDAAVIETTIAVPPLLISTSSGIHENPFGAIRFWFRTDDRINTWPFVCTASFYATDSFLLHKKAEGIICSDSHVLQTVARAQIHPSYTYAFTKPIKWKLCPDTLITATVKQNSSRKTYYEGEIRPSITLAMPHFSTKLSAVIKDKSLYSEKTGSTRISQQYNLTITFSRITAPFNMRGSIKISVNPVQDLKVSQRLRISLRKSGTVTTTISCSTFLTEKRNSFSAKAVRTSFSAKYRSRKIRYMCKLTLITPFFPIRTAF